MADASGTPTSPDNIPTFNTGVDPPSGKGFNTAMAQIQAIFTNLKAGTLASGKIAMAALNATGTPANTNFLRGDGTWTTSPTITTSTLAGGPPASPKDGDIWIATTVDSNDARWQFQFNAGSGSAHKWDFIGGPALTAPRNGSLTTGSTSLVVLTGAPTLTVPRTGEYIVTVGGFAQAQTISSAFDSFMVATNAGSAIASGHFTHTAIFSGGNLTETFIPASLIAGNVIDIRVALGAATGTCSFQNGWLSLVPLRII
jgi:hypothetical protein